MHSVRHGGACGDGEGQLSPWPATAVNMPKPRASRIILPAAVNALLAVCCVLCVGVRLFRQSSRGRACRGLRPLWIVWACHQSMTVVCGSVDRE